jgi:hypothetical protein
VSRGLGKTQRALLLALARIEVGAAERAAERQQRYSAPTWTKLWKVLAVACEHEFREPLTARLAIVSKDFEAIDGKR